MMVTQNKNVPTKRIHPSSLSKRMLQGGIIALILIVLFLLGAGDPKPEWGKLWMIRPLIIVPFAGAMGGLSYYYMDHLRYRGGWRKVIAIILSLVVYIFGLWLGTVLGLDGTYWD